MKFDDTIVIESRDEQRKSLSSWGIATSARNLVALDAGSCRPRADIDVRRRPFQPMDDVGHDWGEQDSLANVPRRKIDPTIRAAITPGDEGDR